MRAMTILLIVMLWVTFSSVTFATTKGELIHAISQETGKDVAEEVRDWIVA